MATRTKRAAKAAAPKKKTTKAATATRAPKGPARGGKGVLVIVESPTKARTIRGFLPEGYRVEASMGHVRDLPGDAKEIPAKYKQLDWSRLGVNVAADFEPLYVVPSDKKGVVRDLKAALDEASELILATDEDREGESISWHLAQVLQPKVPVRRMVFHEITRDAIQEALANTREIDDRLVRAQETRRILDRLVGYTLSPLLWKKIAWGLSAGRVQSVAMRLLVVRERERRAFRAGTWWDLVAQLRHEGQGFKAELVQLAGKKVASGRDFDETTGRLVANRDVVLLGEAEAATLRDRLLAQRWTVAATEEKPSIRRPWAPFTTSTLQQEANRKLRLSARDTMRTAQSLYERGFITYMRTDSVNLSEQAIGAARSAVKELYGKEFLPDAPRRYSTKAANAQEAHEAIRPAGSSFRLPQDTGLDGRELALYDLIWKRTVASQMADARQTALTASIEVGDALFRANGKRIDFPGFLRAYVEGSDDPEAALEDQEIILPDLAVGDAPACEQLDAVSHQTQPPARYTEATLVKALEADGVGRPSTYASIIGTILERGYAQRQGQALVPTFTAFAVTALLEEHFEHLVDEKFTARMEDQLDEIAEGRAEWLPYLREFYLGDEGLQHQVQLHEKQIDPAAARTVALEGLDAKVKIGKFGPYVEVEHAEEGTVRASIPKDAAPADLDGGQVDQILRQKISGPDELGRHPETNEPIFVLTGQYGPYLQLGEMVDGGPKPKRASLPKGVTPETVTLDMAVGLLGLPRTLGEHPVVGGKVQAGLGRFGPYVVHDRGKDGKDYRSIKGEDDVLTIQLPRALELLAQPKQGRGRRAAPVPKKILGNHPDDEQPIGLFDGQYGPYVKHGDVSASLPRGADPDHFTAAEAIELLAAKRASGGGKKGRRGGARPSRRTAKT
ncbi:MAG TPA: type I DNA topoisomerase [Gemmatimonadales bacterium]|nr:type I DNA topoisomerase [Gemmatimonadales bacterium]